MKRFFILMLCCIFIGLTSCAGGKNTVENSSDIASTQSKGTHTVDVLSYAGQGVIPELDVSIGTYIDTIKEIYHYAESGEDGSEDMDTAQQGEDFDMTIYDSYTEVKVDVGDAYYFYKTKYEGNGVSRIVCLKDAFDFNIGITLSQEVKDAIDTEPSADEDVDSVDFLPGTPENFHRVSYDVNDYTLDFYFTDDFLSCIVLTDNRYWVKES